MQFFLASIIFFLPIFTHAQIVINEIAWMGTQPKEGESVQAAANNEWLELYNNGSGAVSLEGWKLITEDGGLSFTLSGTIAAGGYFLLERGSDEVVPNIAADVVYPFKNNALSNSGEKLFLKDASETVMDTVDAASGWLAGDNTTKETMQRQGSTWVTAIATPRALNNGRNQNGSNQQQTNNVNPTPNPSSNNSNSSGSVDNEKRTITADAGEDQTVAVGVMVNFIGNAEGLKGEPLNDARFWWNFGDGESAAGRSVNHLFRIPGTYTVGLHVSSGEYAASDYRIVKVVPNNMRITRVVYGSDGFLALSNGGSIAVDIGGWVIEIDGNNRFVIPLKTRMDANAEVAFPNVTTRLFLDDPVSAYIVFRYPNGSVASEFGYQKESVEVVNILPHADSIVMPISQPSALSSVNNAKQSSAESHALPRIKVVDKSIIASMIATSSDVSTATTPFAKSVATSLATVRREPHRTNYIFFLAASGISLISAVGYLLFKQHA